MTPTNPRMSLVPTPDPKASHHPISQTSIVGLTSVLGDKRHLGPGRTLFHLPDLKAGQGLVREGQHLYEPRRC